mgnify:CR=1 FL=1
MNNDTTTRGFIAVELSKSMVSTLAATQRSLRTRAKEEDLKIQFIPKAVLYLPIEDLGRPEDPSYEAAILAIKRAVRGCRPFIIGLNEIRGWPESSACEQVQVMVDDSEGMLTRIRQSIVEELKAYGFPVQTGAWHPHIPIARIPEGDLVFEGDTVPSGESMTVDGISVIHRKPTASGNMRFQVRSRILLTVDGSRDGLPLDDAARTEEIAAELNERLSQRKSNLPGRARKRNRQLDVSLDEGLDESLNEEPSNEE